MHKRECDVHTRSRPGGICCFVPATIIPIGPCTKYEHKTKSPKCTSEPTCRICVVCRYICEVQRDLNCCERLRRYGCRSQHAGGYLSSGIEVKNLCVDLVELQRQVIRPSVDLDISESRECEICGKAWELGRNGGIERSSGCYERSVGVEFESGHSRNRENEDDSNTDRIVSSRSATNYPSKAKRYERATKGEEEPSGELPGEISPTDTSFTALPFFPLSSTGFTCGLFLALASQIPQFGSFPFGA